MKTNQIRRMTDGSLLLDVSLSTRTVDGEWIEDGIRLAGCVSLSSRIDGWNRVRNRHKFGDENLIRFKALSSWLHMQN